LVTAKYALLTTWYSLVFSYPG